MIDKMDKRRTLLPEAPVRSNRNATNLPDMNTIRSFGRMKTTQETSIHDILDLLMSSWKLIVSAACICFFLAMLYCMVATRKYTAITTLEVGGYAPVLPGAEIESAYSRQTRDQSYFKTQVAKLTSLGLADNVLSADNLGDEVSEYFYEKRSLLGKLIGKIKAVFSSSSDEMGGKKRYQYDQIFLNQYLDLVNIEPVFSTSLVQVYSTTTDPKLSQRIADAHSEGFINFLRKERHNSIVANLEFLQGQEDEIKGKISEAEQNLAKYAEENELMALTKEENIVLQEISELTKLLSEATGKRIQSESLVRQIESRQESTALDDESIRLLRVSLKEAEAEYARMNKKVTPAYPIMIELKAKIDTLKESVSQQRDQALDGLRAQFQSDLASESKLLEEIEKKKGAAHKTSRKLVQYNILQREYESLKDLHQVILRQLKESQISSASSGSNISISNYAVLPENYSHPRIAVVLVLSLCFGTMVGVALAFSKTFLDRTLKGPEDVRDELGLPSLGIVPSLDDLPPTIQSAVEQIRLLKGPRPQTKTEEKTSELSEKEKLVKLFKTISDRVKVFQGKLPRHHNRKDDLVSDFIAVHSPQAFACEAFRAIRTGLLLSSIDRPPRIIMATSASKGEGKTTFTSNLAVTLAQGSYKTVVVDTDVRQRSLYRRFKISADREGLVDYLAGQSSLSDILIPTGVENLDVITAGFMAPNPSELIGSRKMGEFVQFLAETYDYVLLDVPPILPVADALMLSQIVDGVVMVVRSHSTDKRLAQEALRRLDLVNAPMLGVVVNDVNLSHNAEYGYGDVYNSTYYVMPEEGSEHIRASGE